MLFHVVVVVVVVVENTLAHTLCAYLYFLSCDCVIRIADWSRRASSPRRSLLLRFLLISVPPSSSSFFRYLLPLLLIMSLVSATSSSLSSSHPPSPPHLSTLDVSHPHPVRSALQHPIHLDAVNTPAQDTIVNSALEQTSSAFCNVRPWYSHLLPQTQSNSTEEKSESGWMSAQDMVQSFVDPYAHLRRVASSLPEPMFISAHEEKQHDELMTPPGQLYQRFEYPAIEQACSAHDSAQDMLQSLVQDEDTPKELIQAAVAALLTHHPQQITQHVALPPVSSLPDPSLYVDMLDHPQGVIRTHRSCSFTDASWWVTPAEDTSAPQAMVPSQPASTQHPCLWLGCGQILPSPAALTLHVNRTHIARRQPAHRCLWQGCNRADHVFRHRDKILIHIRLHTNDRPYVCDAPGCNKVFSRADSLDAHRKVHSAQGKIWQCRAPGCTRTYFHAKSLKKHERSAHQLDLDIHAAATPIAAPLNDYTTLFESNVSPSPPLPARMY